MKTNPNEPAVGYGYCSADGNNVADCPGLSKREHFAAMAMQGILASQTKMRSIGATNTLTSNEFNIAIESIALADALIIELNKEKS